MRCTTFTKCEQTSSLGSIEQVTHMVSIDSLFKPLTYKNAIEELEMNAVHSATPWYSNLARDMAPRVDETKVQQTVFNNETKMPTKIRVFVNEANPTAYTEINGIGRRMMKIATPESGLNLEQEGMLRAFYANEGECFTVSVVIACGNGEKKARNLENWLWGEGEITSLGGGTHPKWYVVEYLGPFKLGRSNSNE